MTSTRIRNPLSPRFWLRGLTAGLSLAANAQSRVMDSMVVGDRTGAPLLAPSPDQPRAARHLAVVQNPGLPPMLGFDGEAEPWIGFNIYPPESPLCGLTGQEFDAALDYMVYSSNANALRVWGFQSLNPNATWKSLDHAVASTYERGMTLTIALENQWGDCEPLVNGSRQFKDIDWYRRGYLQKSSLDALSYRDYPLQLDIVHSGTFISNS